MYLALLPFLHGTALLMTALVGADVLVTAGIAVRLARRGFLRGWRRPDRRLGAEICRYGLRGQVGGMLSLINLRLDVVILGALVGPGTLGVYAVASKYAELLRLPGLAVTYVLYPRLAVRDRAAAGRDVAALMPRAFVLTVLAAIPLAAGVPLLPLVYGPEFASAMLPAYILLFGLIGEGVAGLVSAYLYGVGRPGANSIALGVSVVVTVALDLALIPHYHAVGAAVASAAAYLTSSAALLACYFAVRKLVHVPRHKAAERAGGSVMTGRLRRPGRARSASPPLAGALAAIAAAGCGGAGTHPGRRQPRRRPPGPSQPASPLAPLAVYRAAVQVAAADHLRVWIEADMVKRWQEGKASFRAAVQPGGCAGQICPASSASRSRMSLATTTA